MSVVGYLLFVNTKMINDGSGISERCGLTSGILCCAAKAYLTCVCPLDGSQAVRQGDRRAFVFSEGSHAGSGTSRIQTLAVQNN